MLPSIPNFLSHLENPLPQNEPVKKENSQKERIPIELPPLSADKIGNPSTKLKISGKVTAILNTSKTKWNFEKILKQPDPIRNMILKGIPANDLKALQIALSKGTAIDPQLKLAQAQFHLQINKEMILPKRILENKLQDILNEHPAWESALMGWKWCMLSVEDKIWLLQIYELCSLGVKIPQIDALYQPGHTSCIPSQRSLELLKTDTKHAINQALAKVTILNLSNAQLKKYPQAICLLINLQELNLTNNNLTVPPDLSRNVNLQNLVLCGNQLSTPPDVSLNTYLQVLNLSHNRLTTPPDVRQNINLERLDLSENRLTAPPDICQNVKLRVLDLHRNQLTTPPDVSQNVKLEELKLNFNQLTALPDVSQNVNLKQLYIFGNKLTKQAEEELAVLEKQLNKKAEEQLAAFPPRFPMMFSDPSALHDF